MNDRPLYLDHGMLAIYTMLMRHVEAANRELDEIPAGSYSDGCNPHANEVDFRVVVSYRGDGDVAEIVREDDWFVLRALGGTVDPQ